MDTLEVVVYTFIGTGILILGGSILLDRKAWFPPREDPPVLTELFAQLDQDVAAVIKDAQAIRQYGASKMPANSASPVEGGEPALPVNAP
jgi:hypothetical protein